jgi:SAM-dependent methyltransferase
MQRMKTDPSAAQAAPATASQATGPALPSPGALAANQAQARFWDRFARRYAATAIPDLAGYETTLARVGERLAADHTVLEIGCGTGSTALRLAPRVRHWLGIDLSPRMIAIARDKLAAQPVPQLRFEVGEAERWPLGTAEHDVVLAFNVLHLVADLDHVLATIWQGLKPGGRFMSKTPCVAELNPLITRLALPLLRAVRLAPPVLCFDEAQLLARLQRHGFVIEQAERHGTRKRDLRLFVVAHRPA